MAHYDWVPISKRQPLKWPNGKRMALIITMNCEYWDLLKDSTKPYYAGGPPTIPDALPGNVADYPNFTWREYGLRVGCWRMFDLFDSFGVPLSVTFNAKTALERGEVIERVKAQNWELVAHNYEQGELLPQYMFDPEGEKAVIHATLKVYEKVVGRKAPGWLSSSLRSTPNTPEILAEAGCKFLCDYMNDDQPYLIHTAHGALVNVPYSVEINDFTFFHRRAMTSEDALLMLKSQFNELYAESAKTGKMMNIGLHPHVSGHPHRMQCFRDFLSYVKQFDDVWHAKREEVADWYLANHESHIAPR